MRELYTDESTYTKYYDNSSSNYSSSSNESTQLRAGSAEFNLLSQAEKDARGGTLNTKIAEKDAIERLVKDLGIPPEIARAIVTNNTSLLKEKSLDVSLATASLYLKLAGINATNPNSDTKYINNFIGLSIS
ncbi:MAG: hypothetical protein KGO93_08125 [Cyanobacteria bacterium REEB446]|nr:hypothetical protein [Cyanobacteria bacterium REEB446]